MTVIEIKQQIQQALDTVPENKLTDILNYVNQIKTQPASADQLSQHLDKILQEDREVLQRLAQ